METFRSFDGTEIAFRRWGHQGSAPPIVLHHGFTADSTINFVVPGIVAALVDVGRWVVALDARGHGHSGKPHDPMAYGEEVMARDLCGLFDHLGVAQVDLVGYSMGAVVTLIAASEDVRVRRLAVGGVGAGVVELGGVDTRVIPKDALVAGLLADDPSSITDAGAAAFRAFADSLGDDLLALAAQAASAHDTPIDLRHIRATTLVLAGRDDPLAERPEVLAGAIPGALLRLVDGDHFGAVIDPGFVEALVEFLR